MRVRIKQLAPFCILLLSPLMLTADWKSLETGLELGLFSIPAASGGKATRIHILRIDPGYFRLQLLNASAPGNGTLLSAKEWAKRHNLVAAINSSMYRTDYKTSVSYMRTRDHINNPYLSRDKSILAFTPRKKGIPDVRIIDRECDRFDSWKARYSSFVQSIRMISCKGRNVWTQQPQKWSTAAIGTDTSGRVLFIHSRMPNSTHDFIKYLLSLPVQIDRAMYAEGGAEAQLYIRSRKEEYEFTGIPEAYSSTLQFGSESLPIPNIVGVARK